MSEIIELDSDHKKEYVVDYSEQTPVLVNFWAPWSQTNDAFRPVLETVVDDYGIGLIHVNVDHKKSVAESFDVRGVPDVRLLSDGSVLGGFAGALPEPEVRGFVEENLPNLAETGSS